MPSQLPVDFYFKHKLNNTKNGYKIASKTAKSKCCKKQLTLNFFFKRVVKNNSFLKTELKYLPDEKIGMNRTIPIERNLDAKLRQILNVRATGCKVNSSKMFARRPSNSILDACTDDGTIIIDDDDDDDKRNDSDNENDVIFVSCQPGTSSGIKEKLRVSKSPSTKEILNVLRPPVAATSNHLKPSQHIRKSQTPRKIKNLITGDKRNKEKQEININVKGFTSLNLGINKPSTLGALNGRNKASKSVVGRNRSSTLGFSEGKNKRKKSGVDKNRARKSGVLSGRNESSLSSILNGRNEENTSGVLKRRNEASTSDLHGKNEAGVLSRKNEASVSGFFNGINDACAPDVYKSNKAGTSGVLHGKSKASTSGVLYGKNEKSTSSILNGRNEANTSVISSKKRKSDTDMKNTKARKKTKTPPCTFDRNSSDANSSFSCAGFNVSDIPFSNRNEFPCTKSKVNKTEDSQSVEFVSEYVRHESNSMSNKTCSSGNRISAIQCKETEKENKLETPQSIELENEENVCSGRVRYISWKDKSPEHKNVVSAILHDTLKSNTVENNKEPVQESKNINGLSETIPRDFHYHHDKSNLQIKTPRKWVVTDFDIPGSNLELNKHDSGHINKSQKPCSSSSKSFENPKVIGSDNGTISEDNHFNNSSFKIDPKKLGRRFNTSPSTSNSKKTSNTNSSSTVSDNIDSSDSENNVIKNSEKLYNSSDVSKKQKLVDNNNPTCSKYSEIHPSDFSIENENIGDSQDCIIITNPEELVIIEDSEEFNEGSNSELQLNACESINKLEQSSMKNVSEVCMRTEKSTNNIKSNYNDKITNLNPEISEVIPANVSRNLTLSLAKLGEVSKHKSNECITPVLKTLHQNVCSDSNQFENIRILPNKPESLADKINKCHERIRDKLATSPNLTSSNVGKGNKDHVNVSLKEFGTNKRRKSAENSLESRPIVNLDSNQLSTETNQMNFPKSKCRKQLDLSSNSTVNYNKSGFLLKKSIPVFKEENHDDSDEEDRHSPSILSFQGNAADSDRHVNRSSILPDSTNHKSLHLINNEPSTSGTQNVTNLNLPSTSGTRNLEPMNLPSTSRIHNWPNRNLPSASGIETPSGIFTQHNLSPRKVFKYPSSPVVSPKTSPAKRAAIKFIKKAKKLSQRLANASSPTKSENNAVKARTNTSPAKNTSPSKRKTKEHAEGSMTLVYFVNFTNILVEVLEKMKTYKCLSPEELMIIISFNKLDTLSKKLYIRMLCRKYDWHRVAAIEYSDINSNLLPHFQELERNDFIHFDYNDEELDKMLHRLSCSELKELSKHFNLPCFRCTKGNLIQELLKYGKTQKTMFTQTDSNDIVKKRVREKLGDCFKLRDWPRDILLRLFLIYVLPILKPGDLGLYSTFMMMESVRVNAIKYFGYTVCLSDLAHIYLNRINIIGLQYANELQNAFLSAVSLKNYDLAREAARSARTYLMDHLSSEELNENVKKLPLFLRKFMAGSVFAYIITDSVDIFKKEQKFLREATEMLEALLAQDLYLVRYRGAWYEKLSLLYHRHLNEHTKAAEVIIRALKDEHLDEVKRYALNIRGLRLHDAKKTNLTKVMKRQLYHSLEDETKLPDPPSITINGKSLQSNKSGNKRVYIQEDAEEQTTTYLSVEELALSHYQKNGYVEGQHFENTIIVSLFGLLFWDVIYETSLPDVFQSIYQIKPLDLNYPEFYKNRKELIDQKIVIMKTMTIEQLQDLVKERFELHAGTESIVNWTALQSSENLSTILSCLTPNLIVAICERLAKNYRVARSGFPDLVVWSPEHSKCKFVEVKGPSDTLSDNQKLWLDYLIKAGADAEVCQVKATGSQSAKLKPIAETSTTVETA